MSFAITHRKPRGWSVPDLTGQVVGLCVVDSKAPPINSSQRWRIRCRAMHPDRDECGALFYLTTAQARALQRPGHELFSCAECRRLRRQALSRRGAHG